MSTISQNAVRLKIGNLTNIANATVVSINLGAAFAKRAIKIHRLEMKMTAASTGTTTTPSLFDYDSTGVDEAITNIWDGTTIAKAVRIEVDVNVYAVVDANGDIFLKPTPDAAADNGYAYRIWWELLENMAPWPPV